MKRKDLALVTIFASLYAVLTWILAPISFRALQFRVSEVLKPSIAKKRSLAIAFMVGNFIANLISPFGGIWELMWMPIVGNLLFGLIANKIAKGNYFVGGFVYGIGVSFSVSVMLTTFGLPFIPTFISLFVSEQILMYIGGLLFQEIDKRIKWY